ncbi:MAG: antibiotic biosynthesis monooxygenase [bacterium]|nr:antibiotic biosynthesis monooxygenase [bacterium]
MLKLLSIALVTLALLTTRSPAAAQDEQPVHWVLDVAIKDGELENLKTLIAEMAESAEAEPGTLEYQWMINEDGSVGRLSERYASSTATLVHLDSFNQNFAERFETMVDPGRFVVLGDPGDKVRTAIAGFNPIYMQAAGGFSR